MSELPLHVEINKHVACIYFSRSSSDNGINANFAEELRGAIDCLEHNDQIRVLLITGSGGSFCVGTDFGSLNQNSIETFKSLNFLILIKVVFVEDEKISICNNFFI